MCCFTPPTVEHVGEQAQYCCTTLRHRLPAARFQRKLFNGREYRLSTHLQLLQGAVVDPNDRSTTGQRQVARRHGKRLLLYSAYLLYLSREPFFLGRALPRNFSLPTSAPMKWRTPTTIHEAVQGGGCDVRPERPGTGARLTHLSDLFRCVGRGISISFIDTRIRSEPKFVSDKTYSSGVS